jgi:hypothetical protein
MGIVNQREKVCYIGDPNPWKLRPVLRGTFLTHVVLDAMGSPDIEARNRGVSVGAGTRQGGEDGRHAGSSG